MSIRHQRLITESNSNIAKPLQHKAMENISLSLWPRDHPLVSKAFTAKLRNWLYSALKRPPLSQLPIGFAICKPLHMPRKVCVRDTRLCSKPSPFAPRLGDVLRVIPTRAYILVYQLTSSETFTLVYTLAFYLAFYMASTQALCLTFYLTYKVGFILLFQLSSILTIWHFIWYIFRHSIWQGIWHSIWHKF